MTLCEQDSLSISWSLRFPRGGFENSAQNVESHARGTLAIGDAPNDLPMFELAHWSIAVGGAFESVITKSDYTSQLPHGEAIRPIVDAILETID